MPGGKVRKVAARWSRAVQKDGPMGLLRDIRNMVHRRLHSRILDRLVAVGHELATVSDITRLDELTIDSDNRADGVEYEATPLLVIGWIQRLLPRDISGWSFIDVGAGRGRVVIAAARYPYRQVLGVEFATEL